MGAMLTHDFIFDVVLPPLLFEAALSIDWRELRGLAEQRKLLGFR
jgi:CPA1 family monovalent cation:H+ antiporter